MTNKESDVHKKDTLSGCLFHLIFWGVPFVCAVAVGWLGYPNPMLFIPGAFLGAFIGIMIAILIVVIGFDDHKEEEDTAEEISSDQKADQKELKKRLITKHSGNAEDKESTISEILAVGTIFALIFICFVAPWLIFYQYGPWYAIGVAVFIIFINVLLPVLLNVNKTIGGAMLANPLVVIVVSILGLIF